MDVKNEAKKDRENGMKYKDIADKYGVSLSTVKSWAMRYWKEEKNKKVATKTTKKLQPFDEKVATQKSKSRGAPQGSQNARGNSGGAPKRNKNSLKHGAYANIYWDTLEDDELELLKTINYDEEHQLQEQINLFIIRERRLMQRIKQYKEDGEKTKGLLVKSVRSSKTVEYESMIPKDGEKPKEVEKSIIREVTDTQTEAAMNTIMVLEEELTKVQKAKTKCIETLAKLKLEIQRIDKDNNVDDECEVMIYIPENGRDNNS